MDNSLTIALKERELYEKISTAGGVNMPIVFNIHPFTEEWNSDTLSWLTHCHAKGMPLYGCTSVKAIATLASMESNVNPFMAASPTYLQLSDLDRSVSPYTCVHPRLPLPCSWYVCLSTALMRFGAVIVQRGACRRALAPRSQASCSGRVLCCS